MMSGKDRSLTPDLDTCTVYITVRLVNSTVRSPPSSAESDALWMTPVMLPPLQSPPSTTHSTFCPPHYCSPLALSSFSLCLLCPRNFFCQLYSRPWSCHFAQHKEFGTQDRLWTGRGHHLWLTFLFWQSVSHSVLCLTNSSSLWVVSF